jgi:hypothetical protein
MTHEMTSFFQIIINHKLRWAAVAPVPRPFPSNEAERSIKNVYCFQAFLTTIDVRDRCFLTALRNSCIVEFHPNDIFNKRRHS